MVENEWKKLRKAYNLTQAEMSERTGIPKRSIENWEGGKTTPPSYMLNLAKAKLEEEERMSVEEKYEYVKQNGILLDKGDYYEHLYHTYDGGWEVWFIPDTVTAYWYSKRRNAFTYGGKALELKADWISMIDLKEKPREWFCVFPWFTQKSYEQICRLKGIEPQPFIDVYED